MTSQTLAVLKGWFSANGIPPTEAQFHDMLESFTPTATNLVVAANDAPTRIKDYADYVCDGVNDEVQVAAAVSALPATGGQVSLSSGNFNMYQAGEVNADTLVTPYCVLIDATVPPLSIVGIPGATILKLADAQQANTGIFSIRGTGAAPRTNPTHLYGLEIDGIAAAQPAWDNLADILAAYSSEVTIDTCRFKSWKRNGFHAFRIAQKAKIHNSYFLGQGAIRLENHFYTVTGNIFEDDVETAGVSNVQLVPDYDVLYTILGGTLTGNIFIGGSIQLEMNAAQACSVVGNIFANQSDVTGFSIWISPNVAGTLDARNNVVVGNTFYNCASAIIMSGSGSYGSKNNLIALNNIMDGPDRNIGIGIQSTGGTTGGNRIIDNFIDATAATKISAVAGDVVRGNANYVTENDGAAASVADGGTIAHGCAAAPTVATVSGSVAGEIVTVTSIDATNITVAIKDNDGSAGTTQTVYWSAEV